MDPKHKLRNTLTLKTKLGTKVRLELPKERADGQRANLMSVIVSSAAGNRVNSGWMHTREGAPEYEPPDWDDPELAAVFKYLNLWRMFQNSFTLDEWVKQYGQ